MTSPAQDSLFRRFDELGIETETVEHQAVFTVAESEALYARIPGAHTKNLFLKDAKGNLFLIVAESDTRIDLKTLHRAIGSARLSFGKPDLLMDVLGVPPGSVTAFSTINDASDRITVIIDQRLMRHQRINCHPLVNTATTGIARDDLITFLRSTGHEPRIMSVGTAADGPPTILEPTPARADAEH